MIANHLVRTDKGKELQSVQIHQIPTGSAQGQHTTLATSTQAEFRPRQLQDQNSSTQTQEGRM